MGGVKSCFFQVGSAPERLLEVGWEVTALAEA